MACAIKLRKGVACVTIARMHASSYNNYEECDNDRWTQNCQDHPDLVCYFLCIL